MYSTPSGIDGVSMALQEDWLFRPVLRGLIKAESLIDGSVDMAFIALLNEALDVEQENTIRARKAAQDG